MRRPSEDKAARLVEVFADAAGDPEADKDAFLDPEGRNLLESLLLAAAADERPITHVHAWLVDPADATAASAPPTRTATPVEPPRHTQE